MAEGTRGPIKVGTGYVEIVPTILQKDVNELRTKVTSELAKIGKVASKEVSKAVKDGLAPLPKEAQKQAKKAAAAVEKEAVDSAKTLKKIEKQITKEFGKEAADRFREYRKSELKKRKLLEESSAETKKAIRETVRLEEKANRDRKASAERLEKDRRKLISGIQGEHQKAEKAKRAEDEKTAREATRWLKMVEQAYRENERRKRAEREKTAREEERWGKLVSQAYAEHERRKRREAEQTAKEEIQWRRTVASAYQESLRRQLAAQREASRQHIAMIREQAAAQRAVLQDGISQQQQRMTALRDQIRDVNRDINSTNRTTQSYFTQTGTALRRMGTWFDQVGMSINEAANILSTRFLIPLAGAGTALTTIGVKNADMRLLGQLGLGSAGVSKSVSAEQMELLQQYAIDTPFSIDVMHEYQMKMIRSVASADKKWFSDDAKTRTSAANSAASRTTDLIMAIGDSMARAGNLSPDMFKRAMYAMDMIMDMDRAPTKNVKQLAAASGMGANELAALLGFKNSTEMWKIIGTPAKDGGGVTGVEIMNSMLNYWNPEQYKGRYKGEGSKGFAETMTNETISGRIQQMKERATFELGNLFATEGKGGSYEYTPLGERLMGTRTPVMVKGSDNSMVSSGAFTYEGGIIQQVIDMAEKWGPKIDGFLELFFDGIETVIGTFDKVATWIEESGLADLAKPIAEFLLEWGPLILAVGLLSKVFGKAVGLVGRLFTPIAALTRAGVSAVESAGDTRRQRRARRDARRETREGLWGEGVSGRARRQQLRAEGHRSGAARRMVREDRGNVRQQGRNAYRQQRADNRAGDNRNMATRVMDGFMGRDSRQDAGQRQLRDLERQFRDARDEAVRLRTELRETDRENMRQLRAALAGGNGSVQHSANQASTAINSVQTQAQQVNGSSMDQLRKEIEAVEKAAKGVVSRLTSAKGDVDALNGKHLNNVTTEFSQLKSAAEAAGKEITSGNTRVGNLNNKRVGDVKVSVDDLRDAAKKAADQIGDGAMSSSTSGRVANLNKRRLTDVIAEFKKLTSAADDAYDKIGQGTGAGSLAGRIGLLNGRSLSKVKGHVDDLAKALKKAKDEGDGLDDALSRIGGRTPGGGGGGNSSNKGKKPGLKPARGRVVTQEDAQRYGVLPGYQPGVDNIPAILSPGEAVLRPEVTSAIGADTINTWNALAFRGKIHRHARGTSGGNDVLSLDSIKELMSLQDIAPVGTAMLKTMGLHGASDPLGGSVQGGIRRTGDHSAGIGGSVAATKFKGMYDWMTEDVYSLMRRVPSGIGQVAGILAGALNPIIGDYFWQDVWKGSGNILERGQKYMGHVFSTETVGKVFENLVGGTGDSLGAIWDVVTDPFSAISDGFSGVGEIISGSYNNLIGMIETVKEIKDAPMAYAGRVYDGMMANAEEAMPNTKGLFDFKKGAKVSADIPDIANMIVEPGSGKGVQRWAPVASQALAMKGLPASDLPLVLHRIGVESGGNPNIVNKWDSNWHAGHPSVGLMQVIGPTYQRWAGPFKKTGPFLYGTSVNPLANIYAGLNYATNTYSDWRRALSGTKGYASGTLSASPGLAMVGEKGRELVAFNGGERVFNNEETEGILNGKKYEIHVHEARTEPTPHAVLRALQTAEALYL